MCGEGHVRKDRRPLELLRESTRVEAVEVVGESGENLSEKEESGVWIEA